jgi:molybdopterin converting factor small subunit
VAKVRLTLPPGWNRPGGRRELECEARTVGEAIDTFIAMDPRIEPRIRRDGAVWVEIFLNDRNVLHLDGFATVLSNGDTLRLIPPIAGG